MATYTTPPGSIRPELHFTRHPTPEEARRRYLHGYDRHGHYLAATGSVRLGLDVDPQHH